MAYTVLYPIDGSTFSEKAFEHVVRIGERFEAEILLVHVYQKPLNYQQYMHSLPVELSQQIEKGARENSRSLLQKAKQGLKENGLDSKMYSIEGNPRVEIAAFAADKKVDLIIMGTRGVSALNMAGAVNYQGSTTTYVIHNTPGIPVLVID